MQTWRSFLSRFGVADRTCKGVAVAICLGLAVMGPGVAIASGEESGWAASQAQIERGKPFWLLDALGNLLGLPKKLLLWNRKIDSHSVSGETELAVKEFIDAHPDDLGRVKVRINQWAPMGEFKRLVENERIPWYLRVFPGVPTTLWSSVTGRLLGGDHYNPYTHTVHLFSDDSAVALHELGHAKDFAEHPDPGLYAVGRILPPVTLHQEQVASDMAVQYFKEKGKREEELHSYSVLYPAFGTYAGHYTGLPYGNYAGAGVGHLFGALHRHEQRLGYQALDETRIGDSVREDELSRVLLREREKSRGLLIETLGNDRK